MPRWTIDAPTSLAFDGVVALRIRLISGSVAVLAVQDAPRLDVESISGQPLLVTHEAGILTVTYEDLTWDGLLNWLRPQRHSANVTVTVPKDCPTQLGVVTATAVVSGMSARTSIKSVAGSVTVDGAAGNLDVNTMSADLEAQDVNGEVVFKTVSGDLTIAGGLVSRLDARTLNGRITADVDLAPAAAVHTTSASGDVALRLPATVSTLVDLRSASGQVETAFDGLTTARKTGLGGGTSVSGTLGGGDGRLSVTTMSGSVTLLRRTSGAPSARGRETGTGTAGSGKEGRAR
jgi:putative adhesin